MAPSVASLYLCSTPIGNLEDITLRALDVLRQVSWIAAEDTRHTRTLLKRYEIDTPLTSLHEHNETAKSPHLVERLLAGESGAVVSDAGTPMLSDPGFELVRVALDLGVPVVPVPGPSALLAALVASGLPAYPFYFGGFLPRKKGERRARLESLRSLQATLVFYEVPHRLRTTLDDVASLYPQRDAAVARELTKVHEEFIRGEVAEVVEHFAQVEPRGECVLLIAGASTAEQGVDVDDDQIQAALVSAIEAGKNKKEAIKDVASFLAIDRKRVYRVSIDLSVKGDEASRQDK